MSNSMCGLAPDITPMTGIPFSWAACSCASVSTGLPMAMTMASTFLLINVSSCSASLGNAPPALSCVTVQPLARAASAAALATRACVSDDIWKATMPTSKAWAAVAASACAANAPTSSARFMNLVIVISRFQSELEGRFFQHGGRHRDGCDDDEAQDNVLHVIGRAHQHQPVAQHLEYQRGHQRAGD